MAVLENPRPPSPAEVSPAPQGYEWRVEPLFTWRAPPLVATRCWRCQRPPVAEYEYEPPILGRRATQGPAWRGCCRLHLDRRWIEGETIYAWNLRRIAQ
jgi:hypothetical protein